MASNTPNLNLLKKDPLTDGNETFNIQTMLNDNWDRVDLFAGQTTSISRGGTGKTTAAAALAALGGIGPGAVGNLHVWKRTQVLSGAVPAVPAGYTLGEVEENVHISSLTSGTVGIRYGDSVVVSNDGTVSIPNSMTDANSVSNWGYSAQYGKLNDEFCTVYNEDGVYVTKEVFFYPSGAYLRSDSDGLYATKLRRVTGYPATPEIPAGTHIDYLTSTDPEAYRESSDGAEAYYTLGSVVTGEIKLNHRYAATFDYMRISDSVTVDDSGALSLGRSTKKALGSDGDYSETASIAKMQSDIRGKYIPYEHNSAFDVAIPTNTVLFIPDDTAAYLMESGTAQHIAIDRYQPVIGHAAVPANTTIEYLGQLGGGAKIEVGSYVGTGTESADISLSGTPKAVLIAGNPSFTDSYSQYSAFILRGLPNSTDYVTRAEIIDGGFRVCYASTSQTNRASHLNSSGSIYRYIAVF